MAYGRRPVASALIGLFAVLAVVTAIPTTRAGLRRVVHEVHLAAYAAGIRRPVPVVHPVTTGEQFPQLHLSSLSGAPVTVDSQSSSGVVVYNVFTSWCAYCVAETADVVRAAASLQMKGVRFVGIDQGETPAKISDFIERNGLRYPVLIDTTHTTTAALGARFIPETLVVRDGVVRKIFVGPVREFQIERAAEGA
jgi:cytochrome c biogenesis protein CcmG, thiol:disulfide interchange protein DsbE